MNDKLKNIIVNYLNKEYGELEIKLSSEYPHYIFFVKNGNVIFDYNKNYNVSFISPEISLFIDSFFDLEDSSKQLLIRNWIKSTYTLDVWNVIEDDSVAKIRWMSVQ